VLGVIAADDNKLAPFPVERKEIRDGKALGSTAPARRAAHVEGGPEGTDQPHRDADDHQQDDDAEPDPEHGTHSAIPSAKLVQQVLHALT
jgi:hypothetical protein